MKSSFIKKGMALFLAFVMLFTMMPTIVLAADADYPVIKPYVNNADYYYYKKSVVTVTIFDEIDSAAVANAIYSWDVSVAQDKSVMAWMNLNTAKTAEAGKDRYDLYIAGEGGVAMAASSNRMFYGFSVLEEINGIENLKTGNATSFLSMFDGCSALKSLDLSSFDTSNVTTLAYMCYGCKALESIDMGGWNTSEVTIMNSMLYDCHVLTSADFTGWDTSNVTKMEAVFRNCYVLKELDLSYFDTSKVTTMRFMFYQCKQLRYIYAGSGWTTESIANLNDGVFNCCYAIIADMDINTPEEEEKAIVIYENKGFVFSPPDYDYAKLKEDGGYLTYKDNSVPEKKYYTVTYEFVGDDIPKGVTVTVPVTYEEGTTVTVAATPSADGYIFSGWSSTDADITNGSFVIENDVHIIGSWSKLYKVEYKYDKNFTVPEGAPELPNAVYYEAGKLVDVMGVLYVDGYVFVGWTTDDVEPAGSMFDMPENDVVFYGYFKKPVESVEILGADDIVMDENDTEKINVYVKPEDATIKDIIYESSDKTVAIVDEFGNITAVGEGTATITVASKDDPTKKDTITVTVKIPVTDIEVDRDKIELKPGEEDKITTTVIPENATNKEVAYESGNDLIVEVDVEGNITAISEGTTTITVISRDNPDIRETVTVTVKFPVTDITATDDFIISIDEEKNLEAKVNDDATNKELIYEVEEDNEIVKVDSEGNVIGIGEGTTTITIISKDNPEIKETVTVTVVKDYKVTYEIIGEVVPEGVIAPAEAVYKDGTTVTVEDALAAEGYTFSGWSTDDITVTDGEFTIDRDVHFVGSFKKDASDITVEKNEYDLEIGTKDKIEVTVLPEDVINKEVTYESDDEDVVKVDENGNIEAVGEGEATITITSKDNPDITETVKVTVYKNYKVTYEIIGDVRPEDVTAPADAVYRDGTTVTVEDALAAEGYTFSGWSTDDITVTDGEFTIDRDVHFVGSFKKDASDITVDKTEVEIEIGTKDKIEVTVLPEEVINKEVTYESSDDDIVKVDENGNIEAVGEGEATITITSKDNPDITETVKVTVYKNYKVTYEFIGDVRPEGVTAPADAVYRDGTTVTVEDALAAEGYTFSGWSTEDIAVSDGEFVIDRDVHFVGSFEKDAKDIIVEKDEYNLEVGDEDKIEVTVLPEDATNKEVTYESGNDDIVKVDENGKIIAVGEGTTTITITSQDDPTITETVTVTVTVPEVIKYKVTYEIIGDVRPEGVTAPGAAKYEPGTTVIVEEALVAEGYTFSGWSTKDIAVADGEFTIDRDVHFVGSFKKNVTDITVDKTEIELEIGENDKIEVTVIPDDAENKEVTYESADENIVEVDEEGNIIAKGEGTTTITITSKDDPGIKETVTVTVKPYDPGYVIEVPDSMSVFEGEEKNLGVKVTPAGGLPKPVYTSSDESIVTVDADGNIKGIKAGAATITVDFGGGIIRVIPVVVLAPLPIPVKHHVAFGKTDGIGWYEVSVNGGDFFPQGPNSTLEVVEGSILVVRVQDMWIDDEFDFYVNGKKVPMDPANTITVVVDGYMLIGALSMDAEVPDVEESVSLLDRILDAFARFFNWIKSWFE